MVQRTPRTILADLVSGGELSRQSIALDAEIRRYEHSVGTLREARDLLLERAREDRGWINLLTNGADQTSSNPLGRVDQILLARAAFEGNDPFIKGAVQAKTEFCFGNGIDGPAGDAPEVASILMPMWTSSYNQQTFFDPLMQQTRSFQLLVDGEIFIVLVKRPDGWVEINTLSPLNVKDIVYHPKRNGIPLYYKVVFPVKEFNVETGQWLETGQETVYYKDCANDGSVYADPVAQYIPSDKLVYELEPGDTVVMHVPLNRCKATGFGISDVLSSLRWLNAAKNIAEDQATISQITASLMTMLGLEGDESEVEATISALQADIDEKNAVYETLAPPAGTITATNENARVEIQRAGSQAADAFQNNRMMRIAAYAGLRMPLHYGADPENANLATAKTMELPTMKHFLAYQAIWVSIYRRIFTFQLKCFGITHTVKYDIPVPRMIEAEVRETATAVRDAFKDGTITREQAATRILQLLGFDNIFEELSKVLATPDKSEQLAQQRQAALDIQAQNRQPAPV